VITHSLVIAVVESYGMVEKQCRLMAELLPEHWEMILVDDGSDPIIPFPAVRPQHFALFRTFEQRQQGEWTQKLAINKGVNSAHGEYIVKSDMDHVFTAGAIAAADRFRGDMMLFHRKAARLNEDLTIEALYHDVSSPVDDIYVMRKQLFVDRGGYPVTRQYGAAGKCFWDLSRRPEAQPPDDALIYVVPGEYATYHGLKRVPESVPL